MAPILSSIDPETLKTVALAVTGGSVVIGLVLMKVISSIIGKIVSLVVFAAIGIAGFSQRAQIADCADKVQNQAESSGSVNTKCTFFGQEVTLKVNLPSK